MHAPSITELLIILGIVLLLFGTKKLKTLGADLGSAIRGFKSAVKEGDQAAEAAEAKPAENRSAEAPAAKEPSEKA